MDWKHRGSNTGEFKQGAFLFPSDYIIPLALNSFTLLDRDKAARLVYNARP